MDTTIFSGSLASWMKTGAYQLLFDVPSGSGVFRVVNIPQAQYQTGYASISPGSFKALGDSGNWYGTEIRTCFAEVGSGNNPFYEVTKFRQDTPFLNIYKLPEQFRNAIYEDRHLPSRSYEKSHIVLELAQRYLPPESYSGAYFPSSRDNNGGVLVYNPQAISVEFIYTGMDPPPTAI